MEIDRFDTELIPTLFKTSFDTTDDYSVPFYQALDKIFSHGVDNIFKIFEEIEKQKSDHNVEAEKCADL